MKITITTIVLCLAFTFANAQKIKETEVPASVKDAFTKKYPGSKVKAWEKENTNYEAEFDLNKIESSAVFSTNGSFKELEQEIKVSELPKKISDYCSKNFVGYKLSEAAKITDATEKVTYEAEMNKGKEYWDAIFDGNGDFIKKSGPSIKADAKN